MSFVAYITSTEWIELRSDAFLSIRGNQIADPLMGKSLVCQSLTTKETIEIAEGAFRPTRPGLDGKIWSHILREGIWTSKTRTRRPLDGSFLIDANATVTVFSFAIRLLKSFLDLISPSMQLTSDPIPIQIGQSALPGIVRFTDPGEGRIEILAELGNQEFGSRLDLFLVNKNVFDGIVFVVEVLRPIV